MNSAPELSNGELDALLMRELPGYQSVFASVPATGAVELQVLQLFDWKKLGKFSGWPRLEWHAPRSYEFDQYPNDEFSFARSTNEVIVPKAMNTDAGSIPRVAWSIPGLSPWDYLPAYLIHDWDFEAHHRGISDRTFEEVNLTLAEGIYTLWKTGVAESDPVRIEIIYRAVSSPFGRHIWDNQEP